MTATIVTRGGQVLVIFSGEITAIDQDAQVRLARDGSQIGKTAAMSFNTYQHMSLVYVDSPTSGSHTYTAQFAVLATPGTVQSGGDSRTFQVVEL